MLFFFMEPLKVHEEKIILVPISRAHDLICCGNDLTCRANDLICRGNNMLTYGNDLICCGNTMLTLCSGNQIILG